MSFIRKSFLWIVLVVALFVLGKQYWAIAFPCESPIYYSLGDFDERFRISREEFLQAIDEASLIWEESLNKDLFSPSPKSKLVLNLIYDERQATAEKTRELTANVDKGKQDAESIKAGFLSLQNRYDRAKSEYEQLASQYRRRKGSYETLEAKRLEVNALADEINSLVKQYNFLVSSLNSTISTINQHAGREFEEGEYIYDQEGERINIYEFGNRDILVRVLTHELGHALGLDHNDNPDSIMYYLNTSKNMELTEEDVMGLKEICRIKD